VTVKQDSVSVGKTLEQATRLAAVALEQYELPGLGLRMLGQMPGKLLFRVSSPEKGNFLLRMYAPSPARTGVEETKPHTVIRSEAGLRSQMLWLLDLRRTMRLPVPEPVATVDGSLVGYVSIEDIPVPRNFVFALLRWIPGEEKTYSFSLPEVFSLGSYIARLHRHAEQYTVPEGFVRPRWDWEYLFGASSPLWSVGEILFSEYEMEVLRVKAKRVRQELQQLEETGDAFGIIHRDLHPGNLLSHEGVLYAIDFDHCGWGYYMYDLTISYMSLARFRDRREDMGEALFEGYQRERTIPDDYWKYFETFRTMCLATRVLPALGSLRNVSSDKVSEQPIWKVGRMVENIKELVSSA
jgi:Ser/Thr protein kinase RdoA (MazF antagonist)